MNRSNLLAVLALAVSPFALMAAANAQSSGLPAGMYVGGGIGATFTDDADLDVSGAGFDGEVSFDTGYAGIASIGYKWTNGFRFELEFGGRKNDVDGVSPGGSDSGSVNSLSLFGNLLYDFGWGAFSPYIGAGVGGVHVNASNYRGPGGLVVDDSDNVFGVQGIAGIGYMIAPDIQLFADYRYLYADDPDLKTNAGVDAQSEYTNHTVLLGVRVSFAAPPPPPPPPPPVAREYLVFFDFDSSQITPEAMSVLRTVADNVPKANAQAVRAIGHADRSGPDRYNQRLSLRRAEAVKAQLIQLGVPANEISIEGRGETDPLVPTADGAREPQNRRVQILLD